jgi:hypothetical protein
MKAKDEIALLITKLADGSLPEDEPLFVLRAKDKYAAFIVRMWAACCDSMGEGVPNDKLAEAENLAATMERWPVKQIPGRPETRTNKNAKEQER